MEPAVLKTRDSVLIAGDYYAGTTRKGIILLHMMPANKSSWRAFAPKLSERGLHVLAIDLRGHGSSGGGPDGYLQFTDEEHEESVLDIETAVDFLIQKGVDKDKITLIGASIGANLAIAYMTLHHETKSGVLLSAGTKYRGVDALHAIKSITSPQRLFFATSTDDVHSSGSNYDMNITLITALAQEVERKLVVYKSAGHGTNMFGKEEPDLAEEIIVWLGEK